MKICAITGLALVTLLFLSCSTGDDANPADNSGDRDYRQDMRDFVQAISAWARSIDSDFIVIPQNGHDLLTVDGETNGSPATAYCSAISGVGREDLFFGYDDDNIATPLSENAEMAAFMDIAKTHHLQVLVTDYCSTHAKMDSSYAWNGRRNYLSFAADHRELDNVPSYPSQPYRASNADVTSLAQAKNFLYILNPGAYAGKAPFLAALQATNYDCIIMDAYVEDAGGPVLLSHAEVASLKTKANGGTRIVIAYMSIGEAEEYRYYWQPSWAADPPAWLAGENPEWQGNYTVRYWQQEWHDIIFGTSSSYCKKILDAGFDGVYLDIIDAFEYFE